MEGNGRYLKLIKFKYDDKVIGRMHNLISLLSITNPTHIDELSLLRMEAEAIMSRLEWLNKPQYRHQLDMFKEEVCQKMK